VPQRTIVIGNDLLRLGHPGVVKGAGDHHRPGGHPEQFVKHIPAVLRGNVLEDIAAADHREGVVGERQRSGGAAHIRRVRDLTLDQVAEGDLPLREKGGQVPRVAAHVKHPGRPAAGGGEESLGDIGDHPVALKDVEGEQGQFFGHL